MTKYKVPELVHSS